MAFEEFKNFCPECGKKIKNRKAESGSFLCSECGCEYVRNWRHWIIVGPPCIALLAWVVVSSLVAEPPKKIAFAVGLLLCGLVLFLAPDEYSVVKHGREFESPRDDSDAA